jgi:hypothetical protein
MLTVNRLCGSGFQSIITGAQEIALGESSVVLAGGAENMSIAPFAVRVRCSSPPISQDMQWGITPDSTDNELLSPNPEPCHSNTEGTFEKPSPIQAQCWPIVLAGHDTIGIAETGSGKTVAFGLPGMVHVRARGPVAKKKPFMLVIAPTRELAVQTAVFCEAAGKRCSPQMKAVCIYGGVPKHEQLAALNGGVYGARFPAEIYTRGCHWIPRKFA